MDMNFQRNFDLGSQEISSYERWGRGAGQGVVSDINKHRQSPLSKHLDAKRLLGVHVCEVQL